MRDTIIGLTTITILFGMVWLSQQNAHKNNKMNNTSKIKPIENKYAESNTLDLKNENELEIITSTGVINPCDICSEESDMKDNFTFGEAFKLCRQCLGDDGVFQWKSELYLTGIKEKEKKDNVEQGNTESILSSKDNKETVISN